MMISSRSQAPFDRLLRPKPRTLLRPGSRTPETRIVHNQCVRIDKSTISFHNQCSQSVNFILYRQVHNQFSQSVFTRKSTQSEFTHIEGCRMPEAQTSPQSVSTYRNVSTLNAS